MSITVSENCFKIDTKNTSYCFKVADYGYVMHEYYGAHITDLDLGYIYDRTNERSYIAACYEDTEMVFRPNDFMQEYSAYGISDFRTTALRIRQADGSRAADLRFAGYEIIKGAVKPENLPCATENGAENIETLKITLKDKATDVFVSIYYTVYSDNDVITRFSEIQNKSSDTIYIEKAASMQLDLIDDDYDFIQFAGAWARERHMKRNHLTSGFQGFASRRGTSSHQHNPFFCLARPNTDEQSGSAYGFHLVYSGNHRTEIETTQYGDARVLMGINDEGFCWQLCGNDKFTTPQVLMTYSADGLGLMSRNFHDFIRQHIFRPQWINSRRPLLINNWEATYFDFDEEKLTALAETAGKLGIELLVMDDGWFGKRGDDRTSLGDWTPNTDKLPKGLGSLAKRINGAGLKFGIWMEPEMISEDSDLYRNHPDWVLCIPNRDKSLGRHQFVLDLINENVREYIKDVLITTLSGANIEYLKWDMNRYLTEVYSVTLGRENQGEAYHRYVLALYDILKTVTDKFPNLLIEHCSGGGGRFDTGMLYYSPQIWTSDDTDAAERVAVQFGTSMGYPITSMGSHLSASPNHQTGRATNFDTRANVAYSGTFGYELDINKLTDDERETIKSQCEFYKENYNLINYGDYYRLIYNEGKNAAWCFASKDKKELLVFYVQLYAMANDKSMYIKVPCADPKLRYADVQNNTTFFGDTLQNVGLIIPYTMGERNSFVIHLKA